MTSIPSSFTAACREHSLDLSENRLEVMVRYVDRLTEVNQHMNLVSVRSSEELWMRHVFDSLLLSSRLKADADQRAVDLGSGGGFPGMCLAILRPDMHWLLVDSVGKKERFLKETAEALGLRNVSTSRERAEVLGRDPAWREMAHLVTARAVARLPVLLEYAFPLLKKGGVLAAMKGAQADIEVKEAGRALRELDGRIRHRDPQPGGGIHLWIRKTGATAETFPRPVGVPRQNPL